MTDIRLTPFVKRRGYADHHEINFSDFAKICGSSQRTSFDKHFKVGIIDIGYIVVPMIDRIGFLFFYIKSKSTEAGFSNLYSQRQSYIAKS